MKPPPQPKRPNTMANELNNAVRVIASFPITDEKNQDAMNMRLIAEKALATQPGAAAEPSDAFTAAYMAACKDRVPDYNEIGLYYFRAGAAFGQTAAQAAVAPAEPIGTMVDIVPPATSRDRWMYEQGRLAERDPRTPGTHAALIEECCALIKAADDEAMKGDYMLDSNDCVRVLRDSLAPASPPAAAGAIDARGQRVVAWQPIETAKKHGDPVWLFDPTLIDADANPTGTVDGHWQDDEGWKGAVWSMHFDEWRIETINPTHWMARSMPALASREEPAAAGAAQAVGESQAAEPWPTPLRQPPKKGTGYVAIISKPRGFAIENYLWAGCPADMQLLQEGRCFERHLYAVWACEDIESGKRLIPSPAAPQPIVSTKGAEMGDAAVDTAHKAFKDYMAWADSDDRHRMEKPSSYYEREAIRAALKVVQPVVRGEAPGPDDTPREAGEGDAR